MSTLVDVSQTAGLSSWIEIRVSRLVSNLKTLQNAGPYPHHVMAVIKANAYGHGLLGIARALDGRVAYLGVSSIAEALELKEHGLETPLFLFGCCRGAEIQTVLMEGVTFSVSSFEEAEEISLLSQSAGRHTPVHIKIDTGMGRLGIAAREARKTVEKMANLPALILEGIYTHFPTAEQSDGFSGEQVRVFASLLEDLEAKGIHFAFRHGANSAGHLKIQSPVFNLIRPGLMLYGLYPDSGLRDLARVSPILTLKSRILLLKRIAAGESVGYGRDFVAPEATTIATLPIGYSHGYPFAASNRASVLFKGKRLPLAGRVSMDYLTVNLGNTAARIGDEVILIGEQGDEGITIEELAGWAQTIPYEIATRMSSSIPRFYPSF